MNYFELFQLPICLTLDAKEVKKRYLKIGREFHPDRYAQASPAEQEKAMQLTSLANTAYATLKNPDKRMGYLLTLMGVMEEGEKYQLPPDFLMEVMEVNEDLMELEMEDDPSGLAAIQKTVNAFEDEMLAELTPYLTHHFKKEDVAELNVLKEHFFKHRYLLRIKERLSKFATR